MILEAAHKRYYYVIVLLCTIAIEVSPYREPIVGCSLPNEDIAGFMSRPGDIVIGGTFPVHFNIIYRDLHFTSKPGGPQCQMISSEFYLSLRALIFAIEEINADPEVLPNVTLGFHIFDTCKTLRRAAQGTLLMLSGGKEITPNYHCYKGPPLAGVIGDPASRRSILMAQILGLYRYPQVSYLATSPILSDRNLFPSFFRTVPSDEFQMRGLAQLISHFGWSWFGLLANDDDYGQFGLQIVKQEIMKAGACVAFAENILTSKPDRNAPYLARVIKTSTAKVVVVITSDSDFLIMVEELLRQNVTGNTWIASDAWATSTLLSNKRFNGILSGTVGFAIYHGQMPQFNEYLNSLSPSQDLHDSFLKELWEQSFSCRWLDQENVHALAFNGTLRLLHYVKHVNFQTKDGRRVFFDAKGNPPAMYDIVNWHVPLSKCSPSCPSGFRKVIVPGKPLCCYECARCPQGQFSNETDAAECHPCSWDTWPNLQQDRCLPRPIEFLSYGDPLGYSLAVISSFSSLTPITILGVFIRYNKTPIVRANNYSLSCLLLLSLFLCFLCSLGFIGYPQPEKCLLRQVAFGMVFALCISCVLAKTITVVIAFNATKPSSRLRKWTGVKVSYCVIGFCIFVQITDCALWLIFSPPFHELDTDTQPGVIIANCNEGSPTAFWCMLGYLGLLATISFIVAFLARRLPDSFNEAKLITFSMLAFLSVWVSFIPAYLSARGMYTVAMEVFAILSSSWALVVCIFMPKCYIVLFRPNLNSREHLMGKGRGQK
ncbi:taste receptor type 1 member 1 [Xenopus tropicalis]|uniref:Taste receptor type 1 member 1 n=1 Tax=Xenopus tropicalis TaxID=8364 RepID=A0A8J0SK12_XENTR|nr:taste receptor type 1 member 1 [Xenopus tropicalis]